MSEPSYSPDSIGRELLVLNDEIETQLRDLHRRTERLVVLTKELYEKISPILSPKGETDDALLSANSNSTHLGIFLKDQNTKILICILTLNEIIERVEV